MKRDLSGVLKDTQTWRVESGVTLELAAGQHRMEMLRQSNPTEPNTQWWWSYVYLADGICPRSPVANDQSSPMKPSLVSGQTRKSFRTMTRTQINLSPHMFTSRTSCNFWSSWETDLGTMKTATQASILKSGSDAVIPNEWLANKKRNEFGVISRTFFTVINQGCFLVNCSKNTWTTEKAVNLFETISATLLFNQRHAQTFDFLQMTGITGQPVSVRSRPNPFLCIRSVRSRKTRTTTAMIPRSESGSSSAVTSTDSYIFLRERSSEVHQRWGCPP